MENVIVKALSERDKIFYFFKSKPGEIFSANDISGKLDIKSENCAKRISDLVKSDLLVAVSNQKSKGVNRRLYTIKQAPELFKQKKQSKFDVYKSAVGYSVDSETKFAIELKYQELLKQYGHIKS